MSDASLKTLVHGRNKVAEEHKVLLLVPEKPADNRSTSSVKEKRKRSGDGVDLTMGHSTVSEIEKKATYTTVSGTCIKINHEIAKERPCEAHGQKHRCHW